jgi:hypothetical protein
MPAAKSKRKVRNGTKCACGCGQAPAETTRLRKASCPDCGYIVRLSRDCISRGLPVCPCGLELEPDCLYDGCAAPGELGAAAYSELCARETDSAVRADNARRRGLATMVCPGTAERKCGTFRPFAANCDPSAPADPCPKCGSTAPATFPSILRRTRDAAAADMPF